MRRLTITTMAVSSLLLLCAASSSAEVLSPWWHLTSVALPSYLPPGGQGVIVVTAANLGDGNADPATGGPVVISDQLPPGLEAIAVEGIADESLSNFGEFAPPLACAVASPGSVSCTFTGKDVPWEEYNGEGYPLVVSPYEQLYEKITVKVKQGAEAAIENFASVTGGGAPAATDEQRLPVSGAPVPFGVSAFEVRPEEPGGVLDTQAGSHPFQLTTSFELNEITESFPDGSSAAEGRPAAPVKDLHVKLPPGLIGNPTPLPRCSLASFLQLSGGGFNPQCAASTVVGVARALIGFYEGTGGATSELFVFPFTRPIFNLEPAPGEPARFGFVTKGVATLLTVGVRTGGDYGLTVSSINTSHQVEVISSETTFWGVPGDTRHNGSRGEECLKAARDDAFHELLGKYSCAGFEENDPPPLLSLPTSCSGPMPSTVEGDSWLQPEPRTSSLLASTALPALDGCNRLPFAPEIEVTPDGQQASKPTGLDVDVHVPQEGQLNPEGLAQSNVKNIEVTLPEGVILNPSAADGLEGCSESLVGYEGSSESPTQPGVSNPTFTPYLPGSTAALAAGDLEALEPGKNFCPNASKIAEATIKTPLLANPVRGFVYLASPQNFAVFPQENPFSKHVAMYIVAEDPVSGSLVKLPGRVELGGEAGVAGLAPGQIRATFEDNPQLAFEDAELRFFGGERAPLASPDRCGTYTTNATFTPWSGGKAETAQSHFEITSGPNGGPCPGPALPFSPSLASGTSNNNAGGFSPLTTTLSRPDGDQSIQSVTLHYPPGLSGLLAGVELCGDAQANAGTCGPNSQIGETIVSVGVGGDPFTVTGGKAYLTGPYNGSGSCNPGSPGCAAFGLSIVNPAKAGPFDLQQGRPVVVRAKVEVDPYTTALTITTNEHEPYAIPNIIEGFPLQIQHVNVLINRPGFTFNPTSCAPTKITGEIKSAEGASSQVEVPFQATNCASLKFAPKFSVSTSGKASKAGGASLTTRVVEPDEPQGSQANISTVKVELPKALPSRLTTLQKACTAAQFDTNPAGCPAASMVGHAKVITPLLPVPLEGPAIFVSHGGEAFPSLTMVLQGYGVTIDLVGTTFISKAGITSTTFNKTIDDQPFNTFELTLPEGPYSALATDLPHESHDLCGQELVMPTEFIGQNGAELRQDTPVTVEGCPRTLSVVSKSVKGKTATIRVSVPSAGKLVATGSGLSKASKTAGGATTVTVKLSLTKAKVAFLNKHRTRRLKSTINLTFTPKHGAKLKTSTTVLIG
jgi:hypothetical protein